MHRFLAACIFLLIWICALPVRAESYPRVIFPERHALTADAKGAVNIEVALMQIELWPGVILSATRGTRIVLASAGDSAIGHELRVAGGPLTIVDLSDNAVIRVLPGSYRLASASDNSGLAIDSLPTAQPEPGPADANLLSPGYRVSDAILTQQQKYLDSLKIDVRDINNVLASIIRALVPRRP